jgi:hypothetical protein
MICQHIPYTKFVRLVKNSTQERKIIIRIIDSFAIVYFFNCKTYKIGRKMICWGMGQFSAPTFY